MTPPPGPVHPASALAALGQSLWLDYIHRDLLDSGMHAPTIYFPLIVHEALMVEPTETEPVEVLDDFIEVVKKTCELAYSNPAEALKAPVNTVVGKLDEAKAAHPKTICLSWKKLCQLVAE